MHTAYLVTLWCSRLWFHIPASGRSGAIHFRLKWSTKLSAFH